MSQADTKSRTGPLAAIRVVEFAGLGPTPFAAMMLADLGADVIRVDRRGAPTSSPGDAKLDFLNRGRPSVALDLKTAGGIAVAKALVAQADVVIEGFRPGVMERLGLGPDVLAPNGSRLVYARMTGWGQDGPLAKKAGHDINYIAMTGALHMIGPADAPPPPPLNLLGDFGGGALFVVAGILAALIERGTSGRGQVIDAAMIDGAAMLLTQVFAWKAMGFWHSERGANLLDGGAYFYRCYETAGGGYIAVGAIEPQFHDQLLRGLGLNPAEFTNQMDKTTWSDRAARLAAIFLTRTRNAWVDTFKPYDACVSPVLTPEEAVVHPVNTARNVFVTEKGATQPVPAPRFARSASRMWDRPSSSGEAGTSAMVEWGVNRAIIEALLKS